MYFKEAMHRNRDENSFTSRLFEYSLFRSFNENNSTFKKFITMLKESSRINRNNILERFDSTNIKEWTVNEEFEYTDGMLFVEVYDIYNYYRKNLALFNQKHRIQKELDKTEFDCVIICKDVNGKEHLIVFEVKCYTDLEQEEIKRQNEWLNEFKNAGMFQEFHHFALISLGNLKNGKDIFTPAYLKNCDSGIYIVTWQNIWDYGFIPKDRFFKQDMNLFKHISYDGKESGKRLLAETSLPDI